MKVLMVNVPPVGGSVGNMAAVIEELLLKNGHETETLPELTKKDLPKCAQAVVVDCAPVNGTMYTVSQSFRKIIPKGYVNWFFFNPREIPGLLGEFCLLQATARRVKSSPVISMFVSRHQQKELFERAAEFLSPTRARALMETGTAVDLPVRPEIGCTGKPDKDMMIVPYSRVDEAQKNVREHARITEKFRLMFPSVHKPVYRVPSSFMRSPITAEVADVYDFRDVVTGPAEMAEEYRKYGLFLSTSPSESMGLFYAELLLSGAVGVFLDKSWVDALLPGYPFKGSVQELPSILCYVYKNYDECWDLVQSTVVPTLRERLSLALFEKRLVEMMSKFGGRNGSD